jgi:CBS-domain-containing membrane protein
VGIVALYGFGNSMFVISLAVGIAIMLMQFFRVVHPPAGADPLVVILAGKTAIGLSFLVTPILVGSVMLVVIATVINNWGKEGRWPVYWHGIGSAKEKDDAQA